MSVTDLLIGPYRLLHRYTDSELITIRILISSGSEKDPAGKPGLAHFIEHMFFKGTETKTYKEMNGLIAGLGDANAYTEESRTVYYINCLAEDFSRAFDLLVEMLSRPRFDPEEFEKERNVILEELEYSLNSPVDYFWDTMKNRIFGDRAHDIGGTEKSISEMTIEDIMEFRRKHYDNITFIVVGKVGLHTVTDKIKTLDTSGATSSHSLCSDDTLLLQDFRIHHASKQSALAVITKSVPGCQNSGTASVLQNALGNGMHSLMFDRIREELGLCYNIYTYICPFLNVSAMITACFLDEANIEKAREEIVKIIGKIKDSGIPDELLETSRKNYFISLLHDTQSSDDYAERLLDPYYTIGCRISDYEEERGKILQVTNKDIMDFASRYFNETGCLIMTEK